MSFAQPEWLIIGGLICCLLVFLFRVLAGKRKRMLNRFVAPQLAGKLTANTSEKKRTAKQILFITAVMLIFTAFARPQFGHQWIDVKRKGIDLLFALDTSKSMLAEDIRPNRLMRANLAILDFVNRLEGDRVGLMPFAGSAYLMCPLTTDYDAFTQSLQAVNTDIIPKGGTNLAEVIQDADKLLSTSANHKILIILTDGENLQGDAVAAAEKAAEKGLTVYAVGVGTASGELIPVTIDGKQGFVKDSGGNFVTSRLDESTLTTIAEKTGGLYVPLGSSGQGLDAIYQQKLALIPKEDLAERRHKVPIERFEWPLAIALLLLTIELLTGERKNGRNPGKNKKFWQLPGKIMVLILATSIAIPAALRPTAGFASPGEDAYRSEDYLAASEYYAKELEKTPDDPTLNYNFGTAAYRNNMFDDAATAFNLALKSDDPELQQKTYFNLGNTHYRKGLETLQANPQQTIEQWQKAVDAYEASAKLAPQNEIVQQNKNLVEQQLEELKKQLPPPKEKQQEGNQQNDQNDQNNESKGQQDNTQQQNNNADTQNSEQSGTNSSPEQDLANNEENSSGDSAQSETPPAQNQGDDTGLQAAQENEPQGDASAQSGQSGQSPVDQEVQEQPAAPGKMTEEEAKQLLRSLSSEEGNLNFVPRGGKGNDSVDKDW